MSADFSGAAQNPRVAIASIVNSLDPARQWPLRTFAPQATLGVFMSPRDEMASARRREQSWCIWLLEVPPMNESTKNLIFPFVPKPVLRARRRLLQLRDEFPISSLQFRRVGSLNSTQTSSLVRRVRSVNSHVPCLHTHAEMARIITAIFAVPPEQQGNVVEAGCFKGGSTIKLSIAAKLAGRRLTVFDSFAGLPDNDEEHGRTIFGEVPDFVEGRYAGALEEVTDNVRRYGEIDACSFVNGWFDDTMPQFAEPVAVAFIDVDLAASTRTCIRYLYPLLIPGGIIFSQDGHLPLCIDVLRDEALWEDIGGPKPVFTGLGTEKLVAISKPGGAPYRK